MTDADRYQTLDTALRAVGAEKSATEAHGILCGMLCTPGDTDRASWIAEVLSGTQPKGEAARDCLAALTSLFEETRDELREGELSFEPLMPGDEAPLVERATALGRWCDGFLLGLGLGGLKGSRSLPREAAEVVSDFGEIGRIDPETSEDDDAEAAYAELLEYVRMGALLVLEHVGAPPRPPKRPSAPAGRRLH